MYANPTRAYRFIFGYDFIKNPCKCLCFQNLLVAESTRLKLATILHFILVSEINVEPHLTKKNFKVVACIGFYYFPYEFSLHNHKLSLNQFFTVGLIEIAFAPVC